MVVLLDLDDEGPELEESLRSSGSFSLGTHSFPASGYITLTTGEGSRGIERPLSNESGFSAALACYPVAIQLARSLDLNSLHALSCTCHRFREILLQFRKQLMLRTLRCSSDALKDQTRGNSSRISGYQSWDVTGSFGITSLRITSKKLGPCARDMVGNCRRCGRVVCRNCIMKSPPMPKFTDRHRRLCSICARASLDDLTSSRLNASPITNDSSLIRSAVGDRDRCSCLETLFICQPCGHAISNADVNYKRIWEWRTRYSTYLGGLGTGIGEGNEGVKCGRGMHCLAAEDIEVETDCRSKELSSLPWTGVDGQDGNGGTQIETISETGEKAGYLRQEIEGIGGIVRTKVKRRVRVGKAVEEHEDERERAEYLAREGRGESRSWCGWCDRVIPQQREPEVRRT